MVWGSRWRRGKGGCGQDVEYEKRINFKKKLNNKICMKHGTSIERHASHTYRLSILTLFKDMLELEVCVNKL